MQQTALFLLCISVHVYELYCKRHRPMSTICMVQAVVLNMDDDYNGDDDGLSASCLQSVSRDPDSSQSRAAHGKD